MTFIHAERPNRPGDQAANVAAGRQRPAAAPATEPHQDLLATVAKLRSFSLLLCLDANLADHLVETTLLRAGVCMSPSRLGTNTLGWLCGRLRSYFYSEYARRPTAGANRGDVTSLLAQFQGIRRDLVAALTELPVEQREVIVLTEAMGFSQRQAARICSASAHVFKGRIDEAKIHLANSLSVTPPTSIADDLSRFASPFPFAHLGPVSF